METTEKYRTQLWCDLKTDLEKAEFIECGRAADTGIIAPSIAADVADAYRRAATKMNEQ